MSSRLHTRLKPPRWIDCAELEARGVLFKDGSWDYRFLVVDDPDGKAISFFNYQAETALGTTAGEEE